MVRLVSGSLKPKNKRKYLSKNQLKKDRREHPEKFISWVSLTEIKNGMGISLPALKKILVTMNLWSGKTVTTHAVESGIARYNRYRGIYEWDKKRLILAIKNAILHSQD